MNRLFYSGGSHFIRTSYTYLSYMPTQKVYGNALQKYSPSFYNTWQMESSYYPSCIWYLVATQLGTTDSATYIKTATISSNSSSLISQPFSGIMWFFPFCYYVFLHPPIGLTCPKVLCNWFTSYIGNNYLDFSIFPCWHLTTTRYNHFLQFTYYWV
jgi:hypothetical protein